MAGKILPLNSKYTLIGGNKILDKSNGSIIVSNDTVFKEIVASLNQENITIQALNTQADVVTSVDSQIIEFYLKTSDGKIDPKDGFLVEVYESGSDGKLTRLYREDLQDPVDNNNIIQDGFSNYFSIEEDPIG
jgi:hypothetical protein